MGESFGTQTPYSGTIETTSESRLYDGTVLRGSYTVQRARDGKGRTYTENAMYCERDQEGNTHLRKAVRVFDPVTHTSMNWTTDRREGGVVNLIHASVIPRRPVDEPRPQPLVRPWSPPASETQIEKLGSKNVAGVVAEGRRTTRTIPVGEEGNSQPITVVDEHWYSADLRMDVAAMHDDPRTGKVSSEFTTLTLGEPDPSLFQAPEGYIVRDRNPAVPAPQSP